MEYVGEMVKGMLGRMFSKDVVVMFLLDPDAVEKREMIEDVAEDVRRRCGVDCHVVVSYEEVDFCNSLGLLGESGVFVYKGGRMVEAEMSVYSSVEVVVDAVEEIKKKFVDYYYRYNGNFNVVRREAKYVKVYVE